MKTWLCFGGLALFFKVTAELNWSNLRVHGGWVISVFYEIITIYHKHARIKMIKIWLNMVLSKILLMCFRLFTCPLGSSSEFFDFFSW